MQNKTLPKAIGSALKTFTQESVKTTAEGTLTEAQRIAEETASQITGTEFTEHKSVDDIASETENMSVTKNAHKKEDEKKHSQISTELQSIQGHHNDRLHKQYFQSLNSSSGRLDNERRQSEELEAEQAAKKQAEEKKKKRFLSPLQMPKGIKRGFLGVKQAVQKGERKDNKRAAA